MTTNQEQHQLQAYLSELERALSGVSSTDRAEIILEIRSHVLDAKDTNPDARVEDILASFGKPEQVATRYLLEKGIKPVIKKHRSWLKLTCGGCLGVFIIAFLTIYIVIKMFSPLIEVSKNENGKIIKMLGGLITINNDDDNFHFSTIDDKKIDKLEKQARKMAQKNSKTDQIKSKFMIEGTTALMPDHIKLKLHGGQIILKTSEDKDLRYSAENSAAENDIITALKMTMESEILIDNEKTGAMAFEIPADKPVSISGDSGHIILDRVDYPVTIALDSGHILIKSNGDKKYRYTLTTETGKVDGFPSSNDADAIPIVITTKSADIVKE